MVERQLAGELQGLIKRYQAIAMIDTGDDEADDMFRQGVEMVLADLNSLLNDATDDTLSDPQGRPFIPKGFRLTAVIH